MRPTICEFLINIIRCCAWMHSSINPILYSFLGVNFRTRFKSWDSSSLAPSGFSVEQFRVSLIKTTLQWLVGHQTRPDTVIQRSYSHRLKNLNPNDLVTIFNIKAATCKFTLAPLNGQNPSGTKIAKIRRSF